MDRIEVGMHVEIKRSDGRVHGSVVTELRPERKMVMVEWFEKGETKGKEIDLTALLEINPTLRSREPEPPLRQVSSNQQLRRPHSQLLDLNDENDETLDDIKGPPRRSILPQQHRSAVTPVEQPQQPLVKPRSTTSLNSVDEQSEPRPAPSKNRRSILPPSKPAIPAPTRMRVPSSSNTTPVESRESAMSHSAEDLDDAVNSTFVDNRSSKGTTVQNIEKLERDREQRRAQQEREKERREMDKLIDEGNPNFAFYAMIRDYRNTLDFRPLKMSDDVSDNRISVCVRKRPLNKKENNKKEIEVVTIPNRDHLIIHQPQVKVDLTKYLENQKYRFDYTFDENTPNAMVYKFTAQPLVRTIFDQGNATCFAYGQTGSGKTHTMGGDFTGKNQNCAGGIYAMTATDVFKLRNKDYRSINLTVCCSFFEIYGAKVFDLLNGKTILRVLEDGKKEVNVCGLKEVVVDSVDEVLDLIRKGTDLRTAGSTSANSNSSRSHAVFQILLKRGKKSWGKFSLIDLAGNERGQDTGNADRQTRMEGAEINKSLLALKECIRAMARNSSHVPFRTSKLTLVLRDSFMGANARTCMIAMISPGMSSCEHTINTIRYADRVKELGADGGSTPLDDDQLMLPKTDDDEDVDLSRLCRSNGADKREYERMRIATQISATEEDTLGMQMNLQTSTKKFASTLESLNKRSMNPDYDQDKWVRDAVAAEKHMTENLAEFRDNLDRWQKLLGKEAQLSGASTSNGTHKK